MTECHNYSNNRDLWQVNTILRKWGNSVATAKFRGLAQNFAARRKVLAWTHIILPSVGEQTFLWDMPLRSNCRKLGFLKRKNWMAHFHDDIIAIVSENNRPAAVYFPVLPREKWVFWWREALYKWRHYSLNKWLTNSLFDSFISLFIDWLAFSALTLLVGHREEHSACKKLMGCWCGYLCTLFAYGPADATAFHNPITSYYYYNHLTASFPGQPG